MEELGGSVRRFIDNGAVNAVAHRHSSHRLCAVGQRLGHRDDIGSHAERGRRKRLAGTTETANHLIEHQQDAVAVADLADSLEIPAWRDEHTG
jgi:hypothetical protein